MLTLKEAILKAENWRGSKVKTVKECGDRWIFTFEDDYPKSEPVFDEKLKEAPDYIKRLLTAPDVIPTFLFKDDGHFEPFYISEYLDLLSKAKHIDLPKEEQ